MCLDWLKKKKTLVLFFILCTLIHIVVTVSLILHGRTFFMIIFFLLLTSFIFFSLPLCQVCSNLTSRANNSKKIFKNHSLFHAMCLKNFFLYDCKVSRSPSIHPSLDYYYSFLFFFSSFFLLVKLIWTLSNDKKWVGEKLIDLGTRLVVLELNQWVGYCKIPIQRSESYSHMLKSQMTDWGQWLKKSLKIAENDGIIFVK